MEKRLLDLSSRTVSKILYRMKLSCFECGWDKASCDIHHRLPKSKGGTDDEDNLTILCPNCHRVAHATKRYDYPSIKEVVGDKWKEFYFQDRTKNPAVRKQISEGMKKAHAEGRSSAWGKTDNATVAKLVSAPA